MNFVSRFFLLLLLLVPFVSAAEDREWIINRDHSEINFTIPYLKFSSVSGRFSDIFGNVSFDRDLVLPNAITLRIRTDSIFTGNKLRDSHLMGPEFFDSKRYPFISFSARSIKAIAPERFAIEGNVTVKNITRSQMWEVTISEPIQDSWKFTSKFVTFEGKIRRQDFGLSWNKNLDQQELILGDDVAIRGVFQLQPSGGKSSGNRHLIPDTKALRQGEVPPVPAPPSVAVTVQSSPTTAAVSAVVSAPPQRDGLWWSAFVILGALGFFAAIVMAWYSKAILEKFLGEQYAKRPWAGVLGDLLTILFVFLYSITYWYIGWGDQ